MNKASFGVIGLGVMGSSLSLNIAEKGVSLAVYNRPDHGEDELVSNLLNRANSEMDIKGFTDLSAFINALERPKKILIMVKAGAVIDDILENLTPLLSEGDIIIDGGNSHYKDTNRRYIALKNKDLHLIGCGISGGEMGARRGPSLMAGGSQKGYNEVASVLESIAAKDGNGKACCSFVGSEGAGHFVKMVHNGIEYVEMQLLAEIYALLSTEYSNEAIVDIFSEWMQTDLRSYLLEITIKILQTKDEEGDVLNHILDKAGNKGTGSWSSQTALQLGTANSMMTSAVFARYLSSFKTKREVLSKEIKIKTPKSKKISIQTLEDTYRFAKIINQHQGFELLNIASEAYNWNLNLSEIARIWTKGCIIQSQFMEDAVSLLKTHQSYLDDKSIKSILIKNEESIKNCIRAGMDLRIAMDTFWSAYNYWISMTTNQLPANLIQAQRDYFGSHGYQKIGESSNKLFHYHWNT